MKMNAQQSELNVLRFEFDDWNLFGIWILALAPLESILMHCDLRNELMNVL